MNKLLDNQNIKEKISELKKRGHKVVMCHGVFDLIHIGHLSHFNEAKKLGDILIISVTSDKFINKGIGRPVFNIDERLFALSSLSMVDYVIPSNSATAEINIKKIKPNFYVKGMDYADLKLDISNRILSEKKAVKSVGGKIVFTKSKLKSSSKILFDNNFIFPEKVTKFLVTLKKHTDRKNINTYFDRIKKLKVLIVGDTIIDRYVFCNSMGKASKDPMIVYEKLYSEMFLGGAASIASNCSALVDDVVFVTKLGLNNKQNYKFVKKKLRNVKLKEINSNDSPINEKLRYVDELSNTKLMGLYDLNSSQSSEKNYKQLKTIVKNLDIYDLVIVLDYKHGLINSKIASKLSKHKNCYINCQLNSSNKNDQKIKDYTNSKCIVINENELRFEMRDNTKDINAVIRKFANLYNIKNVVVTQGREGLTLFQKKTNKFDFIPGFSSIAKDKVGAGDIILLMLGLFYTVSQNFKLSLSAASMLAAKALQNYGNENIVNKEDLLKFFSTFID